MKEIGANFCPISDLPRDSPKIDQTKRSLATAAAEHPQRRGSRRSERPRSRYHTVPVTFDEIKEVDEDDYLRNERPAAEPSSRSTPNSISDLYSNKASSEISKK